MIRPSLYVAVNEFLGKMMVGALNSLQSSVMASISSAFARPASVKEKDQLDSSAFVYFIQNYLNSRIIKDDDLIIRVKIYAIIKLMEFLQSFDFMSGVNPTIKMVVYILILVHIAAVGIWCALACPSMWKSSDSFADKVERSLKENKVKHS